MIFYETRSINKKKEKSSVFDKEDKHMASRSGFNWIEHEDYGPVAEVAERGRG